MKLNTKPELPHPSILERFLVLRKRRGWTQAEAAEKLGVSERSIKNWEAGIQEDMPVEARNPKPLTLKAIALFIAEHWTTGAEESNIAEKKARKK
jgi:transcriptional regulator with XRE-family HTH domain